MRRRSCVTFAFWEMQNGPCDQQANRVQLPQAAMLLQPDLNANSLSFSDVVDDALRCAAAFTYAFHVRAATFSGNQMIGNLHTFEHINRHTCACTYTPILMLLQQAIQLSARTRWRWLSW